MDPPELGTAARPLSDGSQRMSCGWLLFSLGFPDLVPSQHIANILNLKQTQSPSILFLPDLPERANQRKRKGGSAISKIILPLPDHFGLGRRTRVHSAGRKDRQTTGQGGSTCDWVLTFGADRWLRCFQRLLLLVVSRGSRCPSFSGGLRPVKNQDACPRDNVSSIGNTTMMVQQCYKLYINDGRDSDKPAYNIEEDISPCYRLYRCSPKDLSRL